MRASLIAQFGGGLHVVPANAVPIEKLAEKLGFVASAALEAVKPKVVTDEERVAGFWGEQGVCRRLGMLIDCGLFRPFPDNETAEVLVRRLAPGVTIGVQIKTCHLAEANARGELFTLRSSFAAAPTTFVVALAWIGLEQRFHENCLVIPSEVLPSIASTDGIYYGFHFRPSGSSSRVGWTNTGFRL